MKEEYKQILMQGNDLLISQISDAINKEQKNKEQLRDFLKEAIAAGDELKKLGDATE